MSLPPVRLVIRKVGPMYSWEPLNRFGVNIHPSKVEWNRHPIYQKKAQAIARAVAVFPTGVIVDECEEKKR